MNLDKGSLFGKLMIVFVFLVLGAVFIGSLGQSINENTQPQPAHQSVDVSACRDANDDFRLCNGSRTVFITLPQDEIVTWTSLTNETGNVVLTENTDYEVNYTLGRLYMLNTTVAHTISTNLTNATFTYYGDLYVPQSTARTILPLILIFFAIGMLIWAMHKLGIINFEQYIK